MPTSSQLYSERDKLAQDRQAAMGRLGQVENDYSASTGQASSFRNQFKERMRQRFNQRSAAYKQLQGAQNTANATPANTLASLEGMDISAAAKAQKISNAMGFANAGIQDAETQYGAKVAGANETAQSVMDGLNAEAEKKLSELEVLRAQYARLKELEDSKLNEAQNQSALERSGSGGAAKKESVDYQALAGAYDRLQTMDGKQNKMANLVNPFIKLGNKLLPGDPLQEIGTKSDYGDTFAGLNQSTAAQYAPMYFDYLDNRGKDTAPAKKYQIVKQNNGLAGESLYRFDPSTGELKPLTKQEADSLVISGQGVMAGLAPDDDLSF